MRADAVAGETVRKLGWLSGTRNGLRGTAKVLRPVLTISLTPLAKCSTTYPSFEAYYCLLAKDSHVVN
jgi:hypothetical protein